MARILVIDDDADARDMLKQTLERAGYEVETAADGKQGALCQAASPADLIITDIIMPEKEGLELIRELKREYPQCIIIAISGGGKRSPDDYLPIAMILGAAYTFAKPVERTELLEKIASLLADGQRQQHG
jgi:DNA-binding NtrC family response regulator